MIKRTLLVTLALASSTYDASGQLSPASARTLARPGDVKVPLLVMHGEQDPLCDVAGSREFFTGVTSDSDQCGCAIGIEQALACYQSTATLPRVLQNRPGTLVLTGAGERHPQTAASEAISRVLG